MSDEIVCPDCGGFIGLEPGDLRQACRCFTPAAGQAPANVSPSGSMASGAPTALRPEIARLMRQAEASSHNRLPPVEQTRLDDKNDAGAEGGAVAGLSGSNGSLDESAGGSAVGTSGDISGTTLTDAPASGKLCRKCGKDLTGHRRIKDSLGYLCRECAKLDAPPEDPDRRPCPECNRMIKPGGFVPYNGRHICRRCFADHMELDKYKKPAPSAAGFVKEEKQKLGRLLMLAGVLLLFMLWSAWIHFGSK